MKFWLYLKYLSNKYYTFGKTIYHVIKVLYRADSHIAGFSVNIITHKDLDELDSAVEERKRHLDLARKHQQMVDDMDEPRTKLDLN